MRVVYVNLIKLMLNEFIALVGVIDVDQGLLTLNEVIDVDHELLMLVLEC